MIHRAGFQDDKITVGAQGAHLGCFTNHQQRVAGLQGQVAHIGAVAAAQALHGQGGQPVAAAKIEALERLAEGGGMRRQHQFHKLDPAHCQRMGRTAGFHLHPLAQQLIHPLGAANGQQQIAALHLIIGRRRKLRAAAADNRRHRQPILLTEAQRQQGLPVERRTRQHAQLPQALVQLIGVFQLRAGGARQHLAGQRGALRQHPPPQQGEEQQPAQGNQPAGGGKIQNPQRGLGRVGGHQQTADQDIGGGEVGRHATQQAAEGDGHQQAAGAHAGLAGGLHGSRQQQGPRRHIIHKQR